MTANNEDTSGQGRVENVAPATAQAAASAQNTEKSASHAHERDLQRITDTHKKINQAYTKLDKTEATNAS